MTSYTDQEPALLSTHSAAARSQEGFVVENPRAIDGSGSVGESEAEKLMAKIWLAVERYGLRSPKMTVFSTGTKLDIEFLFESGRDETLVKAELPGAMVRKLLPGAMVRKIQGLSAMVTLDPELYATTLGYLA